MSEHDTRDWQIHPQTGLKPDEVEDFNWGYAVGYANGSDEQFPESASPAYTFGWSVGNERRIFESARN